MIRHLISRLHPIRTLSTLSSPSSRPSVTESTLSDLRTLVSSSNVSTNKDILYSHGKDEGHFPSVPPDVVVFAEHKEHVQSILTYCNQHGIPVVPFGSGTGLEGGVNAVEVSWIKEMPFDVLSLVTFVTFDYLSVM